MATGASHADIAILLVDARHGAKRQTRRHAAICDLVGIKKVVLAVNKMDAGRLVRGALPRDRARFPRHGRELQFRASHHHPGGGADRRQRGPTLGVRCPGMPGRLCSSYLEVGRSRGRARGRAVPHAGAARAARLGRFPRLCRDRHLGPRSGSASGSSMRGAASAPRSSASPPWTATSPRRARAMPSRWCSTPISTSRAARCCRKCRGVPSMPT